MLVGSFTEPRMPLANDDAFSAARAAHRAGTSFYWAMRLLSRPRREAMFALYAWCRELDDIADEAAAPGDKLARLAAWREELDHLFAGRPRAALALNLAGPIARYALPRAEFGRVIDGMEMDVRGEMVAPGLAALRAYCRCVAGAVGLIALPIFGCRGEAAEPFAKALGEALQFTNILRDLDEDAALGRVYLPEPLLREAGITARDPAGVLTDPALPAACEALADLAESAFAEATAALRHTDRRPLRPALAMMAGYRRLLGRLRRRGWSTRQPRPRLSPGETLWIALVQMWRP